MNSKVAQQTGFGAPSGLNCTAGKDLYTNLSNGALYDCITTGTPGTWQAVVASSGANTALSNLVSPQVNASIGAATTLSIGTAANPFLALYLYPNGSYGTYDALINTTCAHAPCTWTIPDSAADTFIGQNTTIALANKTLTAPVINGTVTGSGVWNASALVAAYVPAIASLTNYPLTTAGDLFLGGASGAAARLASTGYSVLGSGATNPSWITPTANAQCFMSGASSYATTTPSFQACPSGGGNLSSSGSPAQYQIGVFASSSTVTGIAPSATSGVALISQGSSANPAFGAINLAGGSSIVTGVLPAGNIAAALSSSTSVNGTTIPASQTLLYTGGALGTPSSGTLTNATGYPSASLSGAVPRSLGGLNSTSAGTGILRDSTTPAASEISGDCTTSGSNAIICTKANSVAFGGGATATYATNPQIATYQVLAGDFTNLKTILVASGTFTITLVASGAQPPAGQYITILNYGSGVVTIARSGQNVNGGTASVTLPASSAAAPTQAFVISDGTNYFGNLTVGPAVTTLASLTSVNGTSIPSAATLLVNGGALGTPSSGTATNLTGLPLSTGVTGTLQAAQMPALTGDVTNTAGSLATTVGAIGGKTVSLSGSLTTTGAFNPIFAIPSSSTWTFPSGGGTLGLLNANTTGTAANVTGTVAIANGGTNATSSAAGTIPNATSGSASSWTATPTLGAAGTLGSLTMGNATSGLLTLEPVTGALGTVTVSIPAATDTLVNLAGTQTLTGKSIAATEVNSGTLACGQLPALTGDTTTTAGSCAATTAKINGTAFTGTNGHLVSFGASNIPADSGVVAANAVTASSPGVGLCHFAGSTQVCTSSLVALASDVSGTLAAAQEPAHTGDATNSAGSLAMTVGAIGGKTVSLSGNLTTTGAFNPTFAIPSSSTWTLPSGGGTLGLLNANTTGTAANVTGTVAIANGGTNAITAAAALISLLPAGTRVGDILYCSAYSASACTAWALVAGNNSGTNYLQETAAGAPSWTSPSAAGTVTSVATTGPITGGTFTTSGTIACATCGVTGSPLSQFASTTSAQLRGLISDETGTGAAVFGTNPTMTLSGATLNSIAVVGMGIPIIGWQSVLTNSSATSLVTLATAPGAGDYEIHFNLDMHTACTTGTGQLALAFAWAGNSSRTLQTGGMTLASSQGTNSFISGVQPIHVVSGNVTYTPTLVTACATGTATWDGDVYVTRAN